MTTFRSLAPDRAIGLFSSLTEARPVFLQPALAKTVQAVGASTIDAELRELVSQRTLTRLAALGVRGERVFPVPSVLLAAPTLVAYYRMLLGISQKGFAQTYGYGRFLRAESTGVFSQQAIEEVPALCGAFVEALERLVEALPDFSGRDLNDLALLTLGGTFQGSRNVQIGQAATLGVFQTIAHLLEPYITRRSDDRISIENAAGREVQVTFRADPDVQIQELIGGSRQPIVAMEIKGGLDVSNAHNRAGEAEKSHLKAKSSGFNHRWTIISLRGVKEDVVRDESPSTTRIYDVTSILGRSGTHFEDFQQQIAVLLGLPVAKVDDL